MKQKRLVSLLLVLVLVVSMLPASADETMTSQKILQKYPGYYVEDNILQPKDMTKAMVGELFVGNYCIAPGISLTKGSPFLVLFISAGPSNVANYVTVETEYARYDFQASEMKKDGSVQVFCLYDMAFFDMMKHIRMSETASINVRTGRGTPGKTLEFSDAQKEICGEFYDLMNEILQNEDLVSLALVYMVCETTIDHKLSVTKLKDEPKEPEVETVNVTANYAEPAEKTEEEVVYSTPNGPLDFALHSGVKLGSKIADVVDKETRAGCILLTSLTNSAQKATVSNVAKLNLPYDSLYYKGPVAGGDDDSRICYKFTQYDKMLYCTHYILRTAGMEKEESYKTFHDKLVKVYGEPVGTAKDNTLWEYTYNKVGYNDQKPVSKIASYVNVSNLADYSQWVLTGSDGSVILIEHIFQNLSSNGEYNLINYAYYDAKTINEFRNAVDHSMDDL